MEKLTLTRDNSILPPSCAFKGSKYISVCWQRSIISWPPANTFFSDFHSKLLYYACDVTLSVYPYRASLKNMPDHGGNRTHDLWNTSPMLCQLSYAVWSVRVCDISEQNLVPSITMQSNNHDFFLCCCNVLR